MTIIILQSHHTKKIDVIYICVCVCIYIPPLQGNFSNILYNTCITNFGSAKIISKSSIILINMLKKK